MIQQVEQQKGQAYLVAGNWVHLRGTRHTFLGSYISDSKSIRWAGAKSLVMARHITLLIPWTHCSRRNIRH